MNPILRVKMNIIIVVLIKINNSSFDEAIDLPEYDKYEITYHPLSTIESSTTYELLLYSIYNNNIF